MIQKFEYKVIPAPSKGLKGPGIKGAEGRFAYGLETAINELALEGWEYLRADILPSEERQGLTSSQTVYRSMLVFRRPMLLDPVESPGPTPLDDTAAQAEMPETTPEHTPSASDAAQNTPTADGTKNTPSDPSALRRD